MHMELLRDAQRRSLGNFSPELARAMDPSATMSDATAAADRLALLGVLIQRANAKASTDRTMAEHVLLDTLLFPVVSDLRRDPHSHDRCFVHDIGHTNSFAHAKTLAYLEANPVLPAYCSEDAQNAVSVFVGELNKPIQLCGTQNAMCDGIALAWMQYRAFEEATNSDPSCPSCPFEPIDRFDVIQCSKTTLVDMRRMVSLLRDEEGHLMQSMRAFSPELVRASDPTLEMPDTVVERLALLLRLHERARTIPRETQTTTDRLLSDVALFPVLRSPHSAMDIAPFTNVPAHTHSYTLAQALAYLHKPVLPNNCTQTVHTALTRYGRATSVQVRIHERSVRQIRGLSWIYYNAFVEAGKSCPFTPIPKNAFDYLFHTPNLQHTLIFELTHMINVINT